MSRSEFSEKLQSYFTKPREIEPTGVPVVGFKRLKPDAVLPNKAHDDDSGFDLYAVEDVIIEPGATKIVPTGIAVKLPPGMEGQVRPKSGITIKTKLRVQLGTVDNGYTGDVGVIVDNTKPHNEYVEPTNYLAYLINGERGRADTVNGGKHVNRGTYLIRKGDKIAQLVVQNLPKVKPEEIEGDLDETARGAGGYGSTGVRV